MRINQKHYLWILQTCMCEGRIKISPLCLYFLGVMSCCQVVDKHVVAWPSDLWLTWEPYISNIRQSQLKMLFPIVWNVCNLWLFLYLLTRILLCSGFLKNCVFARYQKQLEWKGWEKLNTAFIWQSTLSQSPERCVLSYCWMYVALSFFFLQRTLISPWHSLVLLLSTKWGFI